MWLAIAVSGGGFFFWRQRSLIAIYIFSFGGCSNAVLSIELGFQQASASKFASTEVIVNNTQGSDPRAEWRGVKCRILHETSIFALRKHEQAIFLKHDEPTQEKILWEKMLPMISSYDDMMAITD